MAATVTSAASTAASTATPARAAARAAARPRPDSVSLRSVHIGIAVIACTLTTSVHAQRTPADDLCFDRMPDGEADCVAYINQLRSNPNRDLDDDTELAKALANYSDHISDADASLALRADSIDLLRSVIDRDPGRTDAMYILSSLVEDDDERLQLLKRIAGRDPRNVGAVSTLARNLLADDSPDAVAEAAELLRGSFFATTGDDQWALGTQLFLMYRDYGLTSEALAFQEEFRVYVLGGSDDAKGLAGACRYQALLMELHDTCFRRAVAAAEQDLLDSQPFSRETLEAFETILSNRGSIGYVFLDYAIEIRDLLEAQEAQTTDLDQFHLVFALVVSGERRITSLRAAIAATDAPFPRAEYWLAEALRDEGHDEEAVELLESIARYSDSPYAMAAEQDLAILRERLR